MTVFSTSDPISNQPYLAINGFLISNDVTTPNTLLDVGPGLCRDTTNTFDINLGNWFGETPTSTSGTYNINGFQSTPGAITANNTTVINAAVNGVNGLDTGTFAAAKVYYVHVIFDQTGNNAPACIISLSRTAPTLPAGYSTWRWIGQATTAAGGATFVLGYWQGLENERIFTYDAPIATSVTAGTSATYAAINLSTLVPNQDNLPVWFRANWTANAAADTFNMQGGNSTGDAFTLIAPVAGSTAHTVGFGQVLSQLVATVPTVNYKVSAVGGVAINVARYGYSL